MVHSQLTCKWLRWIIMVWPRFWNFRNHTLYLRKNYALYLWGRHGRRSLKDKQLTLRARSKISERKVALGWSGFHFARQQCWLPSYGLHWGSGQWETMVLGLRVCVRRKWACKHWHLDLHGLRCQLQKRVLFFKRNSKTVLFQGLVPVFSGGRRSEHLVLRSRQNGHLPLKPLDWGCKHWYHQWWNFVRV